ncbi:MAG: DUF3576 domain-containing protein [Rhodosalinus sp.]
MTRARAVTMLLAGAAIAGLTACGQQDTGGDRTADRTGTAAGGGSYFPEDHPEYAGPQRSTVWDVFGPQRNESTGAVNRYIWNGALEVLSFLPVESVDPFTGVITTGYGTPPGGGAEYRATVYVSDPALDARSLKVALQSRSGPVEAATQRAVEDAILARARQLRERDGNY